MALLNGPGRLAPLAAALLLKPDRLPYRPLYLQVEPTNACNLRCDFCIRNEVVEEPQYLSYNRLEELSRLLRPRFVVLGGDGEPLMHERLFDMVRLLKARGSRVNFATNGVLLKKRAAELAESGLDLLKISIDAARPETYRGIRGADAHALIIEGIDEVRRRAERLGRHGPALRFNFVITRKNVGEMAETVELAARSGVSAVSFKTLDTVGVEKRREALTDGIDERALKGEMKRAASAAGRLGVRTNLDYILRHFETYKLRYADAALSAGLDRPVRCLVPWFMIYIKAGGETAPCAPFAFSTPRVSLGNVFREGFDAVWNGPAYREFRRNMRRGEPGYKVCRNCFEAQSVGNLFGHKLMLRGFV